MRKIEKIKQQRVFLVMTTFSILLAGEKGVGKTTYHPVTKYEPFLSAYEEGYKSATSSMLSNLFDITSPFALSASRCYRYPDWVELGILLYKATNGEEKGLEMWEKFTRESTKDHYEKHPDECRKIWSLLNTTLCDATRKLFKM